MIDAYLTQEQENRVQLGSPGAVSVLKKLSLLYNYPDSGASSSEISEKFIERIVHDQWNFWSQ